MTTPHLIYFADAMCSWCWAFAPVIETIGTTFGGALPIRLIAGGLRPGTLEPMTASAKREVRNHWEHVHQASGQPFDYDFFERDAFVYDTHPAARALVVVRREQPGKALTYLERVQHAFYAENRDVTSPTVLADIALAEAGIDRAHFLALWERDELKKETWRDYALSQQTGVTGFPTLLAGPDDTGAFAVAAQGYQSERDLVPALAAWLDSRMRAIRSPLAPAMPAGTAA